MSVSYFVRYDIEVADLPAFMRRYREVHVPLVATWPGLRRMVLHTPLAWRDPFPVNAGKAVLMAQLEFDSPAALDEALATRERALAREDFQKFAGFEGKVIHQAMAQEEVFRMKPKQHLEFVKVDLNSGWERPAGYPPGFWQKILASDLDETNKKGSRTRLLKIDAGAFSTEPFVHDHWEEVYVVQGDLVVGNDAKGKGGEQCFAPTYACRPPGVHHGPFTSRGGCILHEIHYYA